MRIKEAVMVGYAVWTLRFARVALRVAGLVSRRRAA